MPTFDLGTLITTREASERVRRSTKTIRRWVAADRLIPAYQLPGPNGALLFRPEDVDLAAGIRAERAS